MLTASGWVAAFAASADRALPVLIARMPLARRPIQSSQERDRCQGRPSEGLPSPRRLAAYRYSERRRKGATCRWDLGHVAQFGCLGRLCSPPLWRRASTVLPPQTPCPRRRPAMAPALSVVIPSAAFTTGSTPQLRHRLTQSRLTSTAPLRRARRSGSSSSPLVLPGTRAQMSLLQ